MSFEKVTLTLYDLIGYFLPGFLVLWAVALIETTFFHGGFLSMTMIQEKWLFFVVVAYYLGHIANSVGALLQSRFYRWLTTADGRLGSVLYTRVKSLVQERLHLSEEEAKHIHSREVFLISDTYTVVAGAGGEREVLVSREGFYRGSWVAFAVLCLTFAAAVAVGGARFSVSTDQIWAVSRIPTGVLALGCGVASWLMLQRFKFFNRAKVSFSELVYLTKEDAGANKS